MDLKTYKKRFAEDDAVGWLAIDAACEKLYPGQEPQHFAPPIHYQLGGDDPLDGISIYKSKQQSPHHHFVSYGMSELYYNEESAGGDFSRWGFEFTFRLAPFVGDAEPPTWPIHVMNNLARYVFNSKNYFEEFHFIPANGPIRLDTKTDITAMAFVPDAELGTIDTPHGEVIFLQMVGLTTAEYQVLLQNPNTEECAKLVKKLQQNNGLLITDLTRT